MQKIVIKLSKTPGIRKKTYRYAGARIQGSKRHRIRNTDLFYLKIIEIHVNTTKIIYSGASLFFNVQDSIRKIVSLSVYYR